MGIACSRGPGPGPGSPTRPRHATPVHPCRGWLNPLALAVGNGNAQLPTPLLSLSSPPTRRERAPDTVAQNPTSLLPHLPSPSPSETPASASPPRRRSGRRRRSRPVSPASRPSYLARLCGRRPGAWPGTALHALRHLAPHRTARASFACRCDCTQSLGWPLLAGQAGLRGRFQLGSFLVASRGGAVGEALASLCDGPLPPDLLGAVACLKALDPDAFPWHTM